MRFYTPVSSPPVAQDRNGPELGPEWIFPSSGSEGQDSVSKSKGFTKDQEANEGTYFYLQVWGG